MLIDHTGASVVRTLPYYLPESYASLGRFLAFIYPIMRGIGRIAFPIFCFTLVEGFCHTRNAVKYAMRLFLFALISEIPFDFALTNHLFSNQHQNVYFTLWIGLLCMMGISYFERRMTENTWKNLFYILMQAAVALCGLFLAKYLYTDYGFKGVFLILVLYYLRSDHRIQTVFGAIAISWETWGPLGFLPVWFYNGKRGKQSKYFFYLFYPVHLLILGFIKLAITGQIQL